MIGLPLFWQGFFFNTKMKQKDKKIKQLRENQETLQQPIPEINISLKISILFKTKWAAL